ncbi:hypothetical protein SBI67_15540 [Mycolicibacterium sp. 120266]|uniref:hypothetical protein n=1 Tax=Mycolicibacterium sp. 120266 TaxID=3090601 RepID=UPI00299E5D1E|nr:hypothetical protein [Mycolicibacterium sp. 120266]MDX1873535.1 hypothetical protein [Mycolicibacterium sp. 120266]
MNLDEFCSSDQWSMLIAAAEHSKLAAALGGFLITAIALYLKGDVRESVHTLALFSSAVLVLVLSAFVSGTVVGTVVPEGAQRDGICAIAWAQGALATSMLAAGTAALFGGLGWLLAGHAVEKLAAPEAAPSNGYRFLTGLGSWLTFAAALTTTLLLSETSIDYLHFAFHGRPERWLVGLVVLGAAAVVLTSFVLVLRAPGEQSSLGALKVATVCVVVLGVGASWLSMTLARFPKDWLTSPAPPIVLMVLALTFALPAVIAGAICFSAPSARGM